MGKILASKFEHKPPKGSSLLSEGKEELLSTRLLLPCLRTRSSSLASISTKEKERKSKKAAEKRRENQATAEDKQKVKREKSFQTSG